MWYAWKGARRLLFACLAGVAAFSIESDAQAVAGAVVSAVAEREAEAPGARLARLAESLSQCGFDAMTNAAWSGGVSPTAVLPPGLLDEIDQPTAIALLTRVQPERPRGAWEALRLGRARPEHSRGPGAVDGVASPPAMSAPLVYPTTDLDLERACQLMAREALVSLLPAEVRLPADLVRDLLAHAPLPPTNPAADPALARRVQRLERAGRLSRNARLEADRIVAEFDAARVAAEQWRSRHDAFLARVALLADGEEGRALVAIARRVQAARSGWSAADSAAQGARASRSVDEVARSVRKAVAEGQSCYALAETLVALEPVATQRIDSLAVSGEGRLRVGRSAAVVSQESIDAWRRACGLQRSAVGWTGLSARPRPRPPKIRDAPFGIKPL
ncbi:MAG: hypothetical protein RLY21_847 [Planctomycetota bacterium]|jgi:hypothetical protein